MRFIRDFVAKLASALAPRKVSQYVCNSCDLRDNCSLPANRRQLCWEVRAMRPR